MRLRVVAIGRRMPGWVEEAVSEYGKRLPREMPLQWQEVALARRGGDRTAAQLCQAEGEQLLAAAGGDHIVALDGGGKPWSTVQLAKQLQRWQMSGQNVSFLIGGPDGLSPQCLQGAQQSWSLGPLTLPHPLVRVVLVEQLYRAWTITVNHPYHRE